MTYYFKHIDTYTYFAAHRGSVLEVRNYELQKSIALVKDWNYSADYQQFHMEVTEDMPDDKRDFEPISETEFIRNYNDVEMALTGYKNENQSIFTIIEKHQTA